MQFVEHTSKVNIVQYGTSYRLVVSYSVRCVIQVRVKSNLPSLGVRIWKSAGILWVTEVKKANKNACQSKRSNTPIIPLSPSLKHIETHPTLNLSDSAFPFSNNPSTLANGTSKIFIIIDENESRSNNLPSNYVNGSKNIPVSGKNIIKSSLINNTLSLRNNQLSVSSFNISPSSSDNQHNFHGRFDTNYSGFLHVIIASTKTLVTSIQLNLEKCF